MTTKQRAYLKSLAMTMDPIFQIGKNSMTPELTKAVEEALNARELIKVSVLQNCADDPKELAQILDRVELKSHMGVCLDTCHVYDAGYDLEGELDQVLEEFDQVIGLERLKAIHMNDSKNPFASHKDRHEKIGEGSLGLETFEGMVNHPKLKGIPIYLETPNELEGYAREILLLRNMEK